MTRLRQREIAAFSRVLEKLYSDTANETLSQRILTALESLIPCDFASFSLLDIRQVHWHSHAMSAGVSDWPGLTVYRQFFWKDPAVRHVARTRSSKVVKISDFVSLRQYRSLEVYTEIFSRVGCDRRMGFGVVNKPVDLAVSMNRKRRDFSEEDCTLLNLLRPHLLLANSQAQAQQQVRLARARERARLGDVFGAGLVELNSAGQPLWLTPRAETLLSDFFPVHGHQATSDRLPDELQTALWRVLTPTGILAVEGAALQPWCPIWQFAGPDERTLKARLVPGEVAGCWYLLLEETNAQSAARQLMRALRLTLREGEVLYWLREGKTNWEMSAILGNSEKTVSKHLENIFRKLNVENRTAAVRVAMEASTNL